MFFVSLESNDDDVHRLKTSLSGLTCLKVFEYVQMNVNQSRNHIQATIHVQGVIIFLSNKSVIMLRC